MTTPNDPRFDDHSDVTDVVAAVLKEKKVRFTDRRLLWLYFFAVFAVGLLAILSQRQVHQANVDRITFQRQIVVNCLANQANTRQFNDFIDKIEETYRISRLLTPKEVKDRIAFMDQAKTPVPDCPPNS